MISSGQNTIQLNKVQFSEALRLTAVWAALCITPAMGSLADSFNASSTDTLAKRGHTLASHIISLISYVPILATTIIIILSIVSIWNVWIKRRHSITNMILSIFASMSMICVGKLIIELDKHNTLGNDYLLWGVVSCTVALNFFTLYPDEE